MLMTAFSDSFDSKFETFKIKLQSSLKNNLYHFRCDKTGYKILV